MSLSSFSLLGVRPSLTGWPAACTTRFATRTGNHQARNTYSILVSFILEFEWVPAYHSSTDEVVCAQYMSHWSPASITGFPFPHVHRGQVVCVEYMWIVIGRRCGHLTHVMSVHIRLQTSVTRYRRTTTACPILYYLLSVVTTEYNKVVFC